jgi:hypothetical protein
LSDLEDSPQGCNAIDGKETDSATQTAVWFPIGKVFAGCQTLVHSSLVEDGQNLRKAHEIGIA